MEEHRRIMIELAEEIMELDAEEATEWADIEDAPPARRVVEQWHICFGGWTIHAVGVTLARLKNKVKPSGSIKIKLCNYIWKCRIHQ